ncbi:small ribosomal subunit protein bS18-like isoform X2 [Corticium candelabrum]|uniref:small ribosomal subunit protein bS18-like isoform X2 n=1 Tax=Corticium candelabrum TaxID=121492 RepID=UPI002E26AEE4|nr:small ribosomal subunit protein bS18-like isoform X2 [Corticium candelabrum]
MSLLTVRGSVAIARKRVFLHQATVLTASKTDKADLPGCPLCRNGLEKFGYKDALLLRQFLTPDGLIRGRRQTGICEKMQKRISKAIRRSRERGYLPNFKPWHNEN